MGRKRIVRARLDGLDCVVLKVFLSKGKMDLLRAAHYSEVYVRGNGIPVNEWAGKSVLERKHLALFISCSRWGLDVSDELAFFAKMPEIRLDRRHPEWGEPEGRHYAIPLSFPASKVLMFAEESEDDDSSD